MTHDPPTSDQYSAAKAICNSMHRAYRDLRLYPPGHPSARESVDGLAEPVGQYVDQWGTLTLEVQENALALEGEAVYLHETSRDNMAFLLFRDGVRSLSLHPGCEVEELEALVDCLAHADDLAEMEHDIVTALWERDLRHIEYRVVDPFLGGAMLRQGMMDALQQTVAHRLEMVQAPGLSPGDLSKVAIYQVTPRLIDNASLRLTSQEAERIEREMAGLSSVTQDFAEVLLDIAGSGAITAANDVVIRSLTAVVAAFLDAGDMQGASLLIERLGDLETQLWVPAGSTGRVASGAITAEHVRRLLEPAGPVSEDQAKEALSFLMPLKRWISQPLLEVLVQTEDRVVRKAILEMLGVEDAVRWQGLEPLLEDPRWYVVRNAVQLAASAGHEELADQALRLLGHQDVRVRREVVRALERLTSRGALVGLLKALADPDASVRTLGAGAVGRKGGPEHEALILGRIEDRGFPSVTAEEMEAFFGAYADLARDRAVPLLDRSWRKKALSARPKAFRVAAVLALGRVRTPAARAALQEAAKSRDPEIRRAAADAAKEGSSPAWGSQS